MPKTVPLFFFYLLLSFISFAQEQEPPSAGLLTVQQYAEFLQTTAATDTYNLYNEKMGEDSLSACIVRYGEPGSYTYEVIPERADDPVPYVSRLSAKRYCNWLQNGQPTGEQDETTTEEGAYTLDGTMELDPKKEDSANYFLPASTNSQIDPTLSSNLKTYVIVSHFGDRFLFNTASQDNTQAWTIGSIIAGIAGGAAIVATALRWRGAANAEESANDVHLTWEERNEKERKKEQAQEERLRNRDIHASATAFNHIPTFKLQELTSQPVIPKPVSWKNPRPKNASFALTPRCTAITFNKSALFFQNLTGLPNSSQEVALSDRLSMLSQTKRLSSDHPRFNQWGSRSKEYLKMLSQSLVNKEPKNHFYCTIYQKVCHPKMPITWASKEKWEEWDKEFKQLNPDFQELLQRRTTLLNDWETWLEEFYSNNSNSLKANQEIAAIVWKQQIEAIHKEVNELWLKFTEIIRDKQQIKSIFLLKGRFKALFKTIFDHLECINSIEETRSTIKPFLNKKAEIEDWFITWHTNVENGSLSHNILPTDYQKHFNTIIDATDILIQLVDKYQEHALFLRQIREQKSQQRKNLEDLLQHNLPVNGSSFSSDNSAKTDSETTSSASTPPPRKKHQKQKSKRP